MTLQDHIIGVGLASLLNSVLAKGSQVQVRVSSFQGVELAIALKEAGLTDEGDVLLLVSGAPFSPLSDILPDTCFTSSGRTATWGRNKNTHGFVYVQMDQESDAQSTRAMYGLRDSSFFEDDRWTHLLTGIHPDGAPLPPRLEQGIRAFVNAYSGRRRLQLRPFANFLARISEVWEEFDYDDDLSDAEWAECLNEGFPGMKLFSYEKLAKRLIAGDGVGAQRDMRKLIYGSALQRPSGAELDREKILARLKSVTFPGDHEGDSGNTHHTLTKFLEHQDPKALEAVDFEDFSQCLQPLRSTALGGDIAEHLKRNDADAYRSFDKGDWEDRLDAKDGDAALLLMKDPIFEQIPSPLQRRVRRLLPRQDAFSDPIIGILESLESLTGDDPEVEGLRLELAEDADAHLLGLFAFLYGPALKQLSVDLSGQVTFELDPRITATTPWLPTGRASADDERPEGDDDEDEDSTPELASELGISLSFQGGQSLTFLWRPDELGVLTLWTQLMFHSAYGEHLGAIAAHLSDDGALVPQPQMDTLSQADPCPWLATRIKHLKALAQRGLEASLVQTYLEEWCEALDSELDRGSDASEDLLTFLGTDCLRIGEEGRDGGQRAWMLGSHPLRLRWFARWQQLMMAHCKGLLTGSLRVSEENPGFGRQEMTRWSPHRYPPALSIDKGKVLLPVEERGWCETFLGFDADHHTSNELDSASIKTLVDVAVQYVEKRPWKEAGFHILLMLGDDGSMGQEFIKNLTRRIPDTHIILHILAPQDSVDIDLLLEAGGMTSMMSRANRSHFPLVEVRHHSWTVGDALPNAIREEAQIDLAIVPFLFSSQRNLTVHREPNNAGLKWADPVTMRPQTPVDEGQTELVIELRPAVRDRYLDAWGDAVARSKNFNSLSKDDQGSDFLKMLYDIQSNDALYRALRECAREVAVIDIGITRQQVVRLKHAPKLVQLTSGVGKNGDYCLVLASDKAQQSLLSRMGDLIKSLDPALDAPGDSTVDAVVNQATRLSPGLAFVAGDRGVYCAELLGRHGIRRWAETRVRSGGGKVFWIDIDDHPNWFLTRCPDLARVALTLDGDDVQLDVLLCESKVSDDGGAPMNTSQELRSGIALFKDVFGDSGRGRSDSMLWYAALARAIGDAWSPKGRSLSPKERGALMQGRVSLGSVEGLGIIWRRGDSEESEDDDDEPWESDEAVTVEISSLAMLRQLIDGVS